MVVKAGAVILNSNHDSALLLYREKQGDWLFPKGHVENNETLEQTLFREIKEETGLSVELLKELPNFHYTNGGEGMVDLRMYLVQALSNELKTEFVGDRLEWVALDKVQDKLTYENIKTYYKSIREII